MREDRPAYIQRARQQLEALERLLSSDRLVLDDELASAWNTRSLREGIAEQADAGSSSRR